MNATTNGYEETDKRLITLRYDPGVRFADERRQYTQPFRADVDAYAELILAQIDVLRMIRAVEARCGRELAASLRRFIIKCDFIDGHDTLPDRKLPQPRTTEEIWRPRR